MDTPAAGTDLPGSRTPVCGILGVGRSNAGMDQNGLPMVPDPTVFPWAVRLPSLAGVLPFVATFVLLVLAGFPSA